MRMAHIRKGAGARRTRYQLPQRPLRSPADRARFGVRSEDGDTVFDVHAVAPDALVFRHPAGGERCTIHEATCGLQPLMRISRRGQPAAWVGKVVVGPAREHYTVDLGPALLDVRGRPVDHEYTINHGRRTVAAVSRAWVSCPEAYGVEIAPDQDDALILAITVCISLMSGGAGVPCAPRRVPRDGRSAPSPLKTGGAPR